MRCINNIRRIYFFLFRICKTLSPVRTDTCRHRKSHETVHLSHLIRITLCQIIIGCHQNRTVSRKRIQIQGHCSRQSFPFTCIHLRQISLMESNSSQYLHVKRSHSQNPVIRLTYGRKRFRQNLIQTLAPLQTFPEFHGKMGQLLIRQLLHLRAIAPDLSHDFIQFSNLPRLSHLRLPEL